ncbi:MAG: amino acid ABC transporter substrate-binding protein [Gammaproteobacteria bacterium]|nr:amino acid ABC transporter substrate-binding protein [Gammaproteobacteria bacterium]
MSSKTDAAVQEEQCNIVMGWDPWEPYLFADIDGSVRGLDVELMSAMASKAGCEISFAKASWTQLLDRLRAGQVDVVAGASVTEARKQFSWFSAPYRRETFALYVRDTEASKYPFTVMEDVLAQGMKVGVVSDYVYGEQLNRLIESERYQSQFVEVPISELNYVSLLDYSIDGFLEDPFVAATILRKKGYDEDIEQHPLVIDSGGVHFMFSKASVDEATVNDLNEALSDLIADGSYQAILDKYRL